MNSADNAPAIVNSTTRNHPHPQALRFSSPLRSAKSPSSILAAAHFPPARPKSAKRQSRGDSPPISNPPTTDPGPAHNAAHPHASASTSDSATAPAKYQKAVYPFRSPTPAPLSPKAIPSTAPILAQFPKPNHTPPTGPPRQ